MTKLLLITDAWEPQTNGVVTTFKQVMRHLPASGVSTEVIHPGDFATLPMPSYPEIRLARNPWRLRDRLLDSQPGAIHVATEGPLGIYARMFLASAGIPFTTSLHTKFPEYVAARTRIPATLTYRFIRWFHKPASRTLCITESHRRELYAQGLKNLVVWNGGVDIQRFNCQPTPSRPIPRLLFVGRIAVEKNVSAFLELPIEATKVVVGDGPQRAELEDQYPEALWLGYQHGQALVDQFAAADVLVFPSLTDTFGLVMLEANACGTPVAAYPVTGPVDIVQPGINGVLDHHLLHAVQKARKLDRQQCRNVAEQHDWSRVAKQLASHLAPIDWSQLHRHPHHRASLRQS